MKKMMIVMAMVVGLLMSGCATTQLACVKNEMTRTQWDKDHYQCFQESLTPWSAGGSGLLGAANRIAVEQQANKLANTRYTLCMKAHGYTVVEVPKGKKWCDLTVEEKQNIIKQIPNCQIDVERLKASLTLMNYLGFKEGIDN